MRYPTAGEYQEAVQAPASVFTDPALQDAEPELTALGLPEAVTGAFAVVFPMRSGRIRWAVKCFLTDVSDQQKRYLAVSRHLAAAGLPYTAAFDYQQRGIRVHGDLLPLLKMEWLDGISLARFVELCVTSSPGFTRETAGRGLADLQQLHQNWRTTIRHLEAAAIAHGDLQHGNILVAGEANVHLVDYDTMYVPSLQGKQSPEVGHRNYQHPERDESDFGPYVDRFSALVIDTAIKACIHQPDLWGRYSTGENLLFRASDFFDPNASALFDELSLLPEVKAQADVLRCACLAAPEEAPSLDDVASGDDVFATVRATRRSRPSRDVVRSSRTAFERRFAPAIGGIFAASAALLAFGFHAAAVAFPVAATALGLVWTAWQYRRLPAVRRRHRLEREEAYFSRLITGLEAELEHIEQAREGFIARMESEYDRYLGEVQETALRDRLKHHFVGEASSFDGITHKVVVRLKLEGIRTAYHATPERVSGIRQLSEESKARVGMWRGALVADYSGDIPEALSPAEERRVKRGIEVRLEEMNAEMARIRTRIEVQKAERDQLRARMREAPDVAYGRYLLFLLRLREKRP